MSFYSSNEKRRFAEDRKINLLENLAQLKLENWIQTNKREWDWLTKNSETSFGRSLFNRLQNKGEITQNQMTKLREIVGSTNGNK